MSDLLSIGSSGVYSYQRALATISNNIANVGTDGYNRQDVTIASNQPRQLGPNYIGTGSRFDGIKRLYDAFLESNLRNSQSDLSSQGPMSSYVNRLINVMADENIGLSSAMSRFFESARDLATDPASSIARNIFLRDSDGLASRFRELSSQIQLLDDETRQAAQNDVGKINALSQQIAKVNQQLARHSVESKQPPELLDQRDVLLRDLAKVTAIKTRFEGNGEVLVSVGDTQTEGVLVEGQKAFLIGIAENQPGDRRVSLLLDPYGQAKNLPGILSGELGGVLRFREQVLEPAISSLDGLAKLMVQKINDVHTSGIDLEGNPGRALFGFSSGANQGAASIRLEIDNAMHVAAASLFRVTYDPSNVGNAQALVRYKSPSFLGPQQLISPLHQSTVPMWNSASVRLNESGFSSLGLIPQGMTDLTLEFSGLNNTSRIQIFTRDGKHLLGTPLDLEGGIESRRFVHTSNGMESQALYSPFELSTFESKHMGMDVFFGAKADVGQQARFAIAGDVLEPQLVPAQLTTSVISTESVALNGFQVPALEIPNPSLSDIANWLNSYRNQTRVEVSIQAERLVFKYAQSGDVLEPQLQPSTLRGVPPNAVLGPIVKDALVLNGVSLPAFGTATTTVSEFATWLDGMSDQTGVRASWSQSDGLVLSRPEGNTSNDIRLGMGTAGNPTDLHRLGFTPRLYLSGAATDDLLIFSTGSAGDEFSVQGQFRAIDADPIENLRGQNIEIEFTAADRFSLRSIDPETGLVTRLGTRRFDPSSMGQTVSFRGLELQFSSNPQKGDVFTIDANRDGIGNNEAMLGLVNLEKIGFGDAQQNFNEIYIERVNQVGNIARQTAISEQALRVVVDQAREARDAVSGVSLDEEAASLVRFQQAYQANARVMQMASTLFEAILQVR